MPDKDGRQVNVFAVLESEVHTISYLNVLSATLFAISSGFVSLAAGIWIAAAFTETLTPAGDVLSGFGAPMLCVLAVASFTLGLLALRSKRSTLATIRRESTPGAP